MTVAPAGPQRTPGDGEFVVEFNREAVLRGRRWGSRMVTALVAVALLPSLAAAAILSAYLITGGDRVVAFFLVAILVPVGSILRVCHRLWRIRRSWRTHGVPEVAMRVSPTGVRLSVDPAPDPVFLPWDAVAGFRLGNSGGMPAIVVDLAADVDADTPGTVGLDHPDVQRVLRRRRWMRRNGLPFDLRVLGQPVPAIDQALAHYSGGRVRVRAPSR